MRTNRARIVGVSSCRKVEENECCAGGSCQAVKEATAAMFAGVCAAEGVRLVAEGGGREHGRGEDGLVGTWCGGGTGDAAAHRARDHDHAGERRRPQPEGEARVQPGHAGGALVLVPGSLGCHRLLPAGSCV